MDAAPLSAPQASIEVRLLALAASLLETVLPEELPPDSAGNPGPKPPKALAPAGLSLREARLREKEQNLR